MDFLERENLTGKHHHEHGQPQENKKYLTAKTIIGDKILNNKGDVLGDIKDIMLDLDTGGIEYVVMESGGFLGIGQKLFAYPWKMLEADLEKKAFILDQKKEVIQNAPGFDKDYWPKANSRHLDDSDAYWGDFMGSSTG